MIRLLGRACYFHPDDLLLNLSVFPSIKTSGTPTRIIQNTVIPIITMAKLVSKSGIASVLCI
jgi:hypothetical protein